MTFANPDLHSFLARSCLGNKVTNVLDGVPFSQLRQSLRMNLEEQGRNFRTKQAPSACSSEALFPAKAFFQLDCFSSLEFNSAQILFHVQRKTILEWTFSRQGLFPATSFFQVEAFSRHVPFAALRGSLGVVLLFGWFYLFCWCFGFSFSFFLLHSRASGEALSVI